jgi:hypothetical protein
MLGGSLERFACVGGIEGITGGFESSASVADRGMLSERFVDPLNRIAGEV